MDIERARVTFQDYLNGLNALPGAIQVGGTGYEERIESGWVFYFNASTYLLTGRFEDQLVGHGPTLVMDSGDVLQGGSAERPADVLRRFGR